MKLSKRKKNTSTSKPSFKQFGLHFKRLLFSKETAKLVVKGLIGLVFTSLKGILNWFLH